MTQSNKSADKPYNQIFSGIIPKSMSDGGTNLDEGCELKQAEAGQGLDHAAKLIEGTRQK
jgi:hypothetical protein